MSRRRLNRPLGSAIGDCAVWIFPQAGHHLRILSARTFLVTTSMSMTVCPTEPTGCFDSRAPVRGHAFWPTSCASSAGLSGSGRNSLAVGRPSSPGFGPPLWGRDSGVNPPFFPFPFFPAALPFPTRPSSRGPAPSFLFRASLMSVPVTVHGPELARRAYSHVGAGRGGDLLNSRDMAIS